MHASQIIDAHVDLVTRLENQDFRDYLSRVLSPSEREIGDNMVMAMNGHLRAAYDYRVTADMTSLIIHAANSLNAEDRVDTSLPPTQCGIVRFEKPLPLTDIRGKQMLIHWAVWGLVTVQMGTAFGRRDTTAIQVALFNDGKFPDQIAEVIMSDARFDTMLRRVIGDWQVVGRELMMDGTTLGDTLVPKGDGEYLKQIEAEGDIPSDFTNVKRYMHALWLLLEQTVVTTTEEHVRKTSAGLARKKNLPGRVSVIDLRRSSGAQREQGESTVEWAHRWVVRGHWRWQAYGAGRQERKRIWIHPFVKGPEGKPFTQTEKVYNLRR